MKAVILAAGEGTRLRPFTTSEPKGMLPIANRPILEYIIKALAENKVREIIMVVGYKKERIQSYFEGGDDFGVDITYVTQKKRVGKVGTGYALSMAKNKVSGDFLLLPGDNLIDAEVISDLIHSENGDYQMVISESDIPSKYGVVELSRNNQVKNIVEKPAVEISNLISTGIYKLPDTIFNDIEKVMSNGKYDMTSVIQSIVSKRKVMAVQTKGLWKDIVYPWDMLTVNSIALNNTESQTSGHVEKGVIFKGPVSIGEGTVIRGGTHITGPAVIGRGCEIGPNVCIYPSSSIGDNVRIEPFTFIENSIIMNDVFIGAQAHVSDSMIDDGVELAPQFCATSKSSKIEVDDELHMVEHIGALVGERTKIGSQVTIDGGTIVGARCVIESRVRIDRRIKDDSHVM